jgi:hypothetical protein
MKHRVIWVACLLLLLGIIACSEQSPVAPPSEQAVEFDKCHGNPNPGIIPPHGRIHGKTYAQWSAAWWQWLWSAPVDVNPGLDETGEFVTWGQSGPVWFIAPNYGGVTDRYATIPPGKMLFVDVAADFESPLVDGDGMSEAELRAIAAHVIDDIQAVEVEVDGVPIANLDRYRVTSPVPFAYTLPENNMFELFGITAPAGTYDGAVCDGYYIMLAPLSSGEHVIHITTEWGWPGYLLPVDATVHLTVSGCHGGHDGHDDGHGGGHGDD